MDEFTDCLELGIVRDLLLEEVLNGLDVVIGGALDLLHAASIVSSEVADDGFQSFVCLLAERRHFTDLRVASESLQPANLDDDPIANEPVLTEYLPKGFRLVTVTPIDGGDGSECRELHVSVRESKKADYNTHQSGLDIRALACVRSPID